MAKFGERLRALILLLGGIHARLKRRAQSLGFRSRDGSGGRRRCLSSATGGRREAAAFSGFVALAFGRSDSAASERVGAANRFAAGRFRPLSS